MTTTVYYEINEWSVFKLTDLWNRDLVRLPIALFRDINQTKEMVSAFIQRLEFEDGYENEHSSQILFEIKASILGHARGKPRLFNSRDESEHFLFFHQNITHDEREKTI